MEDWSKTSYVAGDDREQLILLPLLHEFWGFRYVQPSQIYAGQATEPSPGE